MYTRQKGKKKEEKMEVFAVNPPAAARRQTQPLRQG